MKRQTNNRGSIIVMVIGLLTMIAMLGASLMVVTHLDALQTGARIARSQVAPTSEGFTSAIVSTMGGDLCLGTNGRYGASEPGAGGWLQFVDRYTTTADPNGSDAWLGPYWYGLVGGSLGLVDTDGDDANESHLFRCAVLNSLGAEYYMAVKPTDASALICLSTGGTPDPNHTPTCPINVDLSGLLGGTYYPRVHLSRCNNYAITLTRYNTDCATRLLQPADSNYYQPFAIGEEMYLRWFKTPAPTETGRLYGLLPPGLVPMSTRALLTTYNCSSVFVRRPDPNGTWPKGDFTVRIVPDVSSDAAAQQTYERTLAMLNELEINATPEVNVRKRMAAAFVANLKAYQSSGNSGAPWDFTPKDGSSSAEPFTAYGLIPDVVITEAYAAHKPDSDPTGPSQDWVWGCAIELMNPTDQPISLANYKLKVGSTDINLSGSVSANGGKRVIWNFKKGSGADGAINQSEVGLPASPGAGWEKKVDLSFLDKVTVRLVRVHGADEVPVDQVSASADLDYEVTDVSTDSAPNGKAVDALRDDDLNRGRYNVAAYVKTSYPSASGTHKLGVDNALAVGDLDAEAKYPVPVLRSRKPVRDVGELLRLYLAGPIKDGAELRPFTIAITETAKSTLFDKLARARGRLDVHPVEIIYGGYGAGDYPDVPAGCLLSEFFTLVQPDQTRDDPPHRVYGRINVSTAPVEVLARLPFPARIDKPGGGQVVVSAAMAAEYILAYRERRGTSDGRRNYGNRSTGSSITGLRGASPSGTEQCFLTPDEVAIPLGDYANTLLGWTDYGTENVPLTKHREYVDARDAIFRAVSNVITVNTDVAIFNIRLQMGNPAKTVWYFVVVVDRGNCRTIGDVPAVILLNEVK